MSQELYCKACNKVFPMRNKLSELFCDCGQPLKPSSYEERRLQAQIADLQQRVHSALLLAEGYRQALQKVSNGEYGERDRLENCKHDKYRWEDCEQCILEVVDAALARKTDSLQLIEVAAVQANGIDVEWIPGAPDVPVGTRLYLIKETSDGLTV